MRTITGNKKGFSLIELLVVLAIIGLIAAIGVPQYGIYIAKGKVKKASNDLLHSMRLARTMAIKENRAYLITVSGNTYSIGFDGNGNGSLGNAGVDGYSSGPVRTINLEAEYGNNVVIGTTSFTTSVPNGPNGIAINNAVSFQFNPDGSVTPSGPLATVYMQHNSTSRGYTLCTQIANASGTINLYIWDGDADHTTSTSWTELR